MLAAAATMITGCKKETKTAQTSAMKFNITDAPGNFDALNIDIQAIKVHSTTSGWITLQSQLGTINILNYVNGNSVLAAQGDVTAGTIDQVQLVLGSGNSVVVNGTTFALSASQLSGLNVNLNGQLQAGGQYNFTFDFDAAQSVNASGSGSFSFTPTVRLLVDSSILSASASGSGSGSISTGTSGSGSGSLSAGTGTLAVSGSSTGSITGSISPAQVASVCISGPDGSSFCTMTNLSGQFTLQAISSGSYSVTITPVLPLVSAHTLSNINVSAGQTTNIGVVTM
jgi:Domain of unknown function (DUF4382)